MSEDGLKNKLVGILENITFEDDDGFPYWLNSLEVEAIATVLTEQGLKFDTVVSHTATFDRAQQERINALERENEELRARLKKAVELPCKVGDTVYGIGITDCDDAHTTDKKQKPKIINDCMKMQGHCEKCRHGHLAVTEFVCTHIQIGENGIGNSNILVVGKNYENYTAKNVFTSREAAEAKLKELEGGRKE